MKNQALFSSKVKSKKLKCRLLQFLFGALRVNIQILLSAKLGLVTKQNSTQLNLCVSAARNWSDDFFYFSHFMLARFFSF